LNAAQFDSFQLPYDLGGGVPAGPAQVQFADTFQNATLTALAAAAAAGAGVFSATCLQHCLSTSTPLFAGVPANGVTMAQALGSWYFNGSDAFAVSSCSGYPCVAQCPGGRFIPKMGAAIASQDALDAGQGLPADAAPWVAGAEPGLGAGEASGGASWLQLG